MFHSHVNFRRDIGCDFNENSMRFHVQKQHQIITWSRISENQSELFKNDTARKYFEKWSQESVQNNALTR